MTDVPMLVNVFNIHKSMWLQPVTCNNTPYLNETVTPLSLGTVLIGFRNIISCINVRYPSFLRHNNN